MKNLKSLTSIVFAFITMLTTVSCGKSESEGVVIVDRIIARKVVVDRTMTGRQSVSATGFLNLFDYEGVDKMSHGPETEVEIHLVPLEDIDAPQVENELSKIGYALADPHALAALLALEPGLASGRSIITQWQEDGQPYFANFDQRRGKSCLLYVVGVGPLSDDMNWSRRYFACVPSPH